MDKDEFNKEFQKTVNNLKKLSPAQRKQVLHSVLEMLFFKELAVDEGLVATVVKEWLKTRKL